MGTRLFRWGQGGCPIQSHTHTPVDEARGHFLAALEVLVARGADGAGTERQGDGDAAVDCAADLWVGLERGGGRGGVAEVSICRGSLFWFGRLTGFGKGRARYRELHVGWVFLKQHNKAIALLMESSGGLIYGSCGVVAHLF